MGYFHHNSGYIHEFQVKRVTEAAGNNVIHVTINHERGEVSFRISTDTRHPNIDIIESRLLQGLTTAKETDAPLQINEYEERFYLFVTYPDGTTEQYTGSRL